MPEDSPSEDDILDRTLEQLRRNMQGTDWVIRFRIEPVRDGEQDGFERWKPSDTLSVEIDIKQRAPSP